MDLIHGAARETRTYSFPEGGSFALVVEPDSLGTIFILGLGRDQDEPADALLADRVERLAGEVGGVVRTHGVTWSVEPSSVGAIDARLGPMAQRSAELPVLADSAPAWGSMRSSMTGRVSGWWTWQSALSPSPLQIEVRSDQPGSRIRVHLVDHGRSGLAQEAGRAFVARHGPEIDEAGIADLVAGMRSLPPEYRGFTVFGAM